MSTDDVPRILVKNSEWKVASLVSEKLMCNMISAVADLPARNTGNSHSLTPMVILASAWLTLCTLMHPTPLETLHLRHPIAIHRRSHTRTHCFQKPLVKRSNRRRTCLIRLRLIASWTPHCSRAILNHQFNLQTSDIRGHLF